MEIIEEQDRICTIPIPLLSGESTSTCAEKCNNSSWNGSIRGAPNPKWRLTEEDHEINSFLTKGFVSPVTLNKEEEHEVEENFGPYVGQEIAEITDKNRQKANTANILYLHESRR